MLKRIWGPSTLILIAVLIAFAIDSTRTRRELHSRLEHNALALDEQRDRNEVLTKDLDRAQRLVGAYAAQPPCAANSMPSAASTDGKQAEAELGPTSLVREGSRAEVEPGGPMAPIAE